ncbi:unnamed protein product [Periconia digitata]|uniref:Uncharacterized protein n=1 Tax=Periconia digitata TaxID=1303443 RepID=A0A9W4USD3_9PLEO|nr:unnamed protein product [Periconia digitata]
MMLYPALLKSLYFSMVVSSSLFSLGVNKVDVSVLRTFGMASPSRLNHIR